MFQYIVFSVRMFPCDAFYKLSCQNIFTNYNNNNLRNVFSIAVCVAGKKINRVACGSAHSLAWSTHKPVSAGKLPTVIPMEYNHLQSLSVVTLRNRLVLLHHFSDLFCPSIPMFNMRDHLGGDMDGDTPTGLDCLRGVLVSTAKVSGKNKQNGAKFIMTVVL